MTYNIYPDSWFGLGIHLITKVPRPGDNEETFAVFRVELPPVTSSLTSQR